MQQMKLLKSVRNKNKTPIFTLTDVGMQRLMETKYLDTVCLFLEKYAQDYKSLRGVKPSLDYDQRVKLEERLRGTSLSSTLSENLLTIYHDYQYGLLHGTARDLYEMLTGIEAFMDMLANYSQSLKETSVKNQNQT